MSMIESSGMNVNRMLDSLGLPESFGDAIGAMIDGQRGDMGGVLRNLFDLQSGLPTKALDQALSQNANPAFARGFVPRGTVNDQHLAQHAATYPLSREVGHNAYIGQKYNFNVGPFQCQGRITGNQYAGSFSKPIELGNDKFLFHGKTYNGLNDIFRDIKDGKIDGNAGGRIPMSMVPHFPSMAAGVAQGNATSGPSDLAQQLIQSIFGPQQGGASSGAQKPGSATGDTGADGASDIMSGPGSLEDKLLLLMDKLAKFMDKQIEDQMQKIEQEMQKQKQGGQAGGSGGGGGLLGTLGGIAGGAVGGPLGGMAGSALGNAVGGGSGSSGGTGSSSEGDKSNLQLLQSQLQQMIERRNQMFQTMTQMLKSLNDTSLAIIRNLKA